MEEWYDPSIHDPLFFLPCFPKMYLEPYVMVPLSSSLPFFDEIFINYGFNKVQWIENLRYFGYEFYVANQVFLVDLRHRSYVQC